MESTRNHVLPWFGSWKDILLTLLLCVAFVPLGQMLLLGVTIPQFVMLIPLVFLFLLGNVSTACALLCGGILALQCGLLFGKIGGLCVIMLLLPVIVASYITAEKRMPFFVSVGISTGVTFLSVGLTLAMITIISGSDIVTLISNACKLAFNSLGDMIDPLLSVFAQSGLVSLPEGYDMSAFSQGMQLGEAAREALISEMTSQLDATYRVQMPMQITAGSIAVGLFGQAIVRNAINKRGELVPYTPAREWLVPSGFGRIFAITYVALFALAIFVGGRAMVLYYTFSGLFDEIFAIQGIAALWYMLHKYGKGNVLKTIVFVLGYFVLRQAAVLIGIFDQAMDFTQRRKVLEGIKDKDEQAES